MPLYSTPGVYYHRTDAGVPRVAPLRTDITGFVGMARRGPLHQALPIESWRQFVAHFGDFTGAAYLAYAVRAFFENGGARCWIVRVASDAAVAAASTVNARLPMLVPPPPYPAWDVCASSAGVWGNDLTFELRATHLAQTVADPALSTPDYAAVTTVAGFIAGTHVRIATDPVAPAFRAVAAVDAATKRLYWINPKPEARSDYEKQLTGYDLNRPLLIESVEYTLLVRELGRVIAVYQGLSLVPDHPRYGPRVLPRIAEAPSDAIGWKVPAAADPVVLIDKRTPMQRRELAPLQVTVDAVALTLGADGLAALSVRDFIGEAGDVLDDEFARREKMRGLRALDPITEVALVAVPDIHIQPVLPPAKAPPVVCVPDPCLPAPPFPPAVPRMRSVGDLPPLFDDEAVYQVQSAAIDHCQSHHDRIALLDPPYTAVRDARLGIDPIRAWRKRFDSTFAALYAPWVAAPDPLLLNGELTRLVPPSGHVAGFVAQTDLQIGVHKAPANGSLNWAQRLSLTIDDASHGLLNEEHVNALRAFPGRGLRVFGARTLSSDPSWRYVNVRRLMLMIEKAIEVSCQWAVFETNDRYTRAKVHLALTSFLLSLWERGALAGASVKEAFFVNCNEDTSPPAARDRGQLIAEVGVAPSTPFEFVVLRVGYGEDAFEISEVALAGEF
ncbi:MAG: phage tail sheath protein [Betaproteobacteria bacterium]|nr:phage tail sheath protein [Betaproteobacteria bacterium]